MCMSYYKYPLAIFLEDIEGTVVFKVNFLIIVLKGLNTFFIGKTY